MVPLLLATKATFHNISLPGRYSKYYLLNSSQSRTSGL